MKIESHLTYSLRAKRKKWAKHRKACIYYLLINHDDDLPSHALTARNISIDHFSMPQSSSPPIGYIHLLISQKSGTTWTQHIVLTLLLADDRKYKIAASTDNNSTAASTTDDDDIAYNHVSDFAPFFEIDAHWQSSPSNDSTKVLAESVRKNHDRLGRRVFNTHLRWDMLPKQREARSGTQQKDDDVGGDDNINSW